MSRFMPSQFSATRKSRLEGKPSLLPKPLRSSSIDRKSSDARPSITSYRSSSAEPPRGTVGVGRLSREASATILQINKRSKSQQGENRHGQSIVTPLRSTYFPRTTTTSSSSKYQQGQSIVTPLRSTYLPTTTPVKTPSSDGTAADWQSSLDRVLGFVTVKDQRPISNPAWQRAEYTRVQAALAQRNEVMGTGGVMLRPLTIARFVEITDALITAVMGKVKLNNDNYISKLPHLSKRLLYPGTVSKSWLKTVNTLHAFPHALALIAYLLDIVNFFEKPVLDELLYLDQDELTCLRRKFAQKCWIRFQDPDNDVDCLNDEHLQNVKEWLGDDEDKVRELTEHVKSNKYKLSLEEEEEQAVCAEEARRVERKEGLKNALLSLRAERSTTSGACETHAAQCRDAIEEVKHIENETDSATAESKQISTELEHQTMTVQERIRLLEEVDYLHRIDSSKVSLINEIAKTVFTKENELALWQKKTLDSSMAYNQQLIQNSSEFPDFGDLVVDEKELMEAACQSRMARGVQQLREVSARLAEQLSERERTRCATQRRNKHLLDEAVAFREQIKTQLDSEQKTLEMELEKESREMARCNEELAQCTARLKAAQQKEEQYNQLYKEQEFWEQQYTMWRTKLTELEEYVASFRTECERDLQAAKKARIASLMDDMRYLNSMIE